MKAVCAETCKHGSREGVRAIPQGTTGPYSTTNPMQCLQTVLRCIRVFCDEAEFPRNRQQKSDRTEIACEADSHTIACLQQSRCASRGLAIPRLVNLSGSYHSLKESLPTCMHVFIAKEQADVVLVTSGREKITRRTKCCYQNRPIIEWEVCSRLLPSER